MKVCVVEDDKEISKLLYGFLTEHGYEVVQLFDGREAKRYFDRELPDVILLDLMLPYKSGEELLCAIRERSFVPVIVLSAKSMLETRLEVLKLGADDYILKPFSLDEVLVRLEVVMRRGNHTEAAKEPKITFGEITIRTDEKRLHTKEQEIALTSKEFCIMETLMQHPDKTFSKANLYESVWGESYCYEDNTINVHVSNLRNKIKKVTGKDYIETVWGIGYRLNKEVRDCDTIVNKE